MRLFRALGNAAPELVVVFLPYKGAPQYRSIKRISDVEKGFATQVGFVYGVPLRTVKRFMYSVL